MIELETKNLFDKIAANGEHKSTRTIDNLTGMEIIYDSVSVINNGYGITSLKYI